MNFVPTTTKQWVTEDFARLSEIIKDYSPRLDLRFIPPDQRKTDFQRDYPYVIVEESTDGESVVFYCKSNENPEDILTRLFAGDASKGDVLKRLDARQAARDAIRMKSEMDAEEERKDKVAWLVGTKQNYIHWTDKNGDKVLLDDQLRRLR